MNHKKYLYSSGEFAKFTGINKRTLHYYNEIGLFCPEVIGENGYHYYTCFQFAQLELILTLRKIGLSLDEIREYVTTPSDESFSQMMIKKKKLIDESINQLLSVQSFLEQKAERLKICLLYTSIFYPSYQHVFNEKNKVFFVCCYLSMILNTNFQQCLPI